jgi:hypothetical protein
MSLPSCLGPFTPGEKATDTHLIGGWLGPRASLDIVVKRKKSLPLLRNQTPVIQPVVVAIQSELPQLKEEYK